MRRFPYIAFSILVTSVFALTTGCDKLPGGKKAEPTTPVSPVSTKPTPPAIDYATVRPNELGRIPVIMYHEIGGKPPKSRAAMSLWRSEASFKGDLEALHKAGFYPVNLGDLVNGKVDVPAGKSPVALTFDDARLTQFNLIDEANTMKVDLNCAVGIMQAFVKSHPDWALRATFFILPKSKYTMESFRQLNLGNQKLDYLVKQGMEIGNHTTSHHSVASMTPTQIQQEIGNANAVIESALPNYKVQTFALPMGKYPRNLANVAHLLKGTYNGVPYQHKAVFLAAYRPIQSPFEKGYNPAKLERINSIDGRFGVRWWATDLAKSGGMYPRYVSDGDPKTVSFPRSEQAKANLTVIKSLGLLPNAYGDVSGAKKIIGAGDAVETPTLPTETVAPAAKPITP